MPSDDADLITVARTDKDIGIRRLAIGKLEEAKVLAEIAAAETERSLRDYAGERAAQLWTSKACGDKEEVANDALSGLLKLGDQHAIVDVAQKAQLTNVRKRAFAELRDPRALAELAKSGDAPQDLRLAAIGRIDDGDVLRAVAIDTTLKEVGLAAVEKLDDVDRLENVSQKAKNKAVRQRARKVVQEMAAAEKARTTPVVSDDIKRRRAEKAQLVRELEALADTFDFEKHASKVKAAEATWKELAATADEGDERFTKAAERFWKRKQVFEEQARSADELRAVEREAQREKERAAAEREAAAQPKPEEPEAPKADDPARAAREAEAKARREEREQKNAEFEARRAAEQAEREARKKEAAERATSLTTSLTAMIEDMEKLAAEGSRDGRSIDRLLQQAARSFEQIGKASADARDALSDRYTAARGKLVVRVSELREAEDWQRFQNVPKAEALIATAREMAAEEPSPSLGNRLRDLQALWKEVGPMPQRRSKELWEQFKKACDDIYDKVKGFRAVESEKFADVTKAKEALIAEAEALAGAEVTPQAANALKALQAKWKESGHLPRKQGDDLWRRFRAACDQFFERRKPLLDAEQAEQGKNLAAKQELITRAQKIADAAPGEGGWGKAIGQIKDLQQEWKQIGYVPRRDADAVYKAFRAACDALFAKRDQARDAEANAHRDAIDDVKAEIGDVLAGGDDVVKRAIELRAKARELDSAELARSIEQMVRHVITSNPDAVKGTELDPTALRARREKLLAKVEELLPKQAPAASAGAPDIAAQLKSAMQKNAFGDLRFSGRDPVEVVDELRTQWIEAGPLLDDADRAQGARFDELVAKVLDAAGAAAKSERDADRADRGDRGDRGDRDGGRRRRRDRRDESVTPQTVHDAATAPAQVPSLRAPAAAAPAPAPAAAAPAPAPAPAPAAAAPAPAPAAAAPAPAPNVAKPSQPTPVPAAAQAPQSTAAPAPVPHTPPPAPAPAQAPQATAPQPVAVAPRPEGPASAAAAAGLSSPPPAAIPQTAHDAITAPSVFQPLPAPAVPAAAPVSTGLPPVSASTTPVVEPPRPASTTIVPTMEEVDDGWDMPDDDPTASADADQSAAADAAMQRPDPPTPPSSSDMAGDGAVGGDGIDEPGWD